MTRRWWKQITNHWGNRKRIEHRKETLDTYLETDWRMSSGGHYIVVIMTMKNDNNNIIKFNSTVESIFWKLKMEAKVSADRRIT